MTNLEQTEKKTLTIEDVQKMTVAEVMASPEATKIMVAYQKEKETAAKDKAKADKDAAKAKARREQFGRSWTNMVNLETIRRTLDVSVYQLNQIAGFYGLCGGKVQTAHFHPATEHHNQPREGRTYNRTETIDTLHKAGKSYLSIWAELCKLESDEPIGGGDTRLKKAVRVYLNKVGATTKTNN